MFIYTIISTFIPVVLGNSLQPRMWYGKEVPVPFSYPYMVSINADGAVCGGALYGNDIVITAGHCIGYPFNKTEYFVHRHDKGKSIEEERAEKFTAVAYRSLRSRKKYSRYSGAARKYGTILNDIAVVKLDRHSKYASNLKLVDRDLSGSPGTLLHLTGWGYYEKGSFPNALREDDYPVINFQRCVEEIGAIPEYNICFGYEDQKNVTDEGDSGSPLVQFIDSVPVLVGIMTKSVGFGPGKPSIAERVSAYRQWILDTIEILHNSNDYNIDSPLKSFTEQELDISNSSIDSLHKNRPLEVSTSNPN